MTKENINDIINIELEGLISRVKKLEYDIELTEDLRNYIVEKGYDPEYGARPLKRAIQKYVEDTLTEEIIKLNPEKGSKLIMDYDDDEDKVVFTTGKKKRVKKKE